MNIEGEKLIITVNKSIQYRIFKFIYSIFTPFARQYTRIFLLCCGGFRNTKAMYRKQQRYPLMTRIIRFGTWRRIYSCCYTFFVLASVNNLSTKHLAPVENSIRTPCSILDLVSVSRTYLFFLIVLDVSAIMGKKLKGNGNIIYVMLNGVLLLLIFLFFLSFREK